MPKVINAKNWNLTPAADGRRYSKFPDGVATPGQVTGLAATGQTSNSITIAWSAVAGATSYEVKVGKATANNVPAADPEETISTQTSPYTLGSIT